MIYHVRYFDGLAQDCSNSIDNAVELQWSHSTYHIQAHQFTATIPVRNTMAREDAAVRSALQVVLFESVD